MNIDLTQILLALISVIGAIVTSFLVPLLKSKLNENQLTILKGAVKIAVFAAEQLYHSDEGQKKKAYVVKLLADQGYSVDTAAVDAMIEATVKELKLTKGTETAE